MKISTSERLPQITTDFCRNLAAITAKALERIPEEDVGDVLIVLQDNTSLYSPFTADLIEELRHETRSTTQKTAK